MDQRTALQILKNSEPFLRRALSIKKELSPYVTYSRNVFIPLTHVCRNRCGYCIFRKEVQSTNIMKKDAVIQLLHRAESFSCTEALFTCGENPDVYPRVQEELAQMGYASFVEYVVDLCEYTVENTLLFPHSNCGVLTEEDLGMLKPVNASMGMMLENSSPRLMKTEAHQFSPGKEPQLRLQTLELAGKTRVPFTTGILVGIGETDEEIYQSLAAIRTIQDRYGCIQEVIIQNFQPKPGTPMQQVQPLSGSKMVNIVVLARLMLPDVSIQVPPNLNKDSLVLLLQAGADDLGGISPVTCDYVNPEYEWPDIAGLPYEKKERLPVYPKFITREYLSAQVYEKALSVTDEEGYVRWSCED